MAQTVRCGRGRAERHRRAPGAIARGRSPASPRRCRRRHHQPQLPRHARRQRLRRAPARQGHRPARHRPRGRAARQRAAPPSSGSRPSCVAAFDDCLVTRFIACDTAQPPASVAERVEEIARALRAFHDSRRAAAGALLGPRPARRVRARSCAERGGALPAAYGRAARRRRAHRRRAAAATTRARATTTCSPATSSAARDGGA